MNTTPTQKSLIDEGLHLNTARPWLQHFKVAHGAAGHVKISPSPQARHVACWGWTVGKPLRDKGHEVLVFERGYLGNRSKWISVAWNGLNGRADFRLPERVTADRFNQHFALKPWKQGGECIIIAGQVRGDASLQGRDLTAWYEEMAVTLERLHGLPVFFKQHPASNGRPNKRFTPRLPEFEGNMADACKVARCIVSWNSNAAVDAVISGCPAMAFDEGSMAWDVTSHDPSQIITPPREDWAARLAWCQWTTEEIAAGAFWPRLLNLPQT